MAYCFKRNEAIPQAVRRVFAEEIGWAVGQLSEEKDRGKAIHEARKSVKKIRGLLSLVEKRLGPLFKQEDEYFRDAGRELSEFRDNTVMRETFETLAAKHRELDAGDIEEIRLNLWRVAREAPPEKNVSADVIALLGKAKLKVRKWPLEGLEFEALMPEVLGTFRKGRRALKRAQKSGSEEHLHDFRKKVKQHWYHLRLLESAGDHHIKKRIEELRELETYLGEEHNLAVLAQRLNREVETALDRLRQHAVMKAIKDETESLRKRALEEGQKLYAGTAGAFREHLTGWVTVSAARKRPVAMQTVRAKSAVA